jgi:hypothetical protein
VGVYFQNLRAHDGIKLRALGDSFGGNVNRFAILADAAGLKAKAAAFAMHRAPSQGFQCFEIADCLFDFVFREAFNRGGCAGRSEMADGLGFGVFNPNNALQTLFAAAFAKVFVVIYADNNEAAGGRFVCFHAETKTNFETKVKRVSKLFLRGVMRHHARELGRAFRRHRVAVPLATVDCGGFRVG